MCDWCSTLARITWAFNGRVGSRLSDRGNFPDQHSAPETCASYDAERLRRCMRDFQFIARAKLLRRDGVTHSEFAWIGHELRLGEHDCTGTGARLSARPRLGRVHAEFRWPDAGGGVGRYRAV